MTVVAACSAEFSRRRAGTTLAIAQTVTGLVTARLDLDKGSVWYGPGVMGTTVLLKDAWLSEGAWIRGVLLLFTRLATGSLCASALGDADDPIQDCRCFQVVES